LIYIAKTMFKKIIPLIDKLKKGLFQALLYGLLWMWIFVLFVKEYNPNFEVIDNSVYILGYFLSVIGIYITRGIAGMIQTWVEEDMQTQRN